MRRLGGLRVGGLCIGRIASVGRLRGIAQLKIVYEEDRTECGEDS